MKWTYFLVESKADQYGSQVREVKRTSRACALAGATGCEDRCGVRTGAYRATTSSRYTVKSILSGEDVAGVEVECLG